MSNGLAFPNDWGTTCPPAEAVAANGTVYRATMNDPPAPDDFRSQVEMGRQPNFKQTKSQACRWRSVSVYQTLADAKQHLAMFPSTGKFVAAGTLDAECGKTKLSPTEIPTHTDWWAFESVDCAARAARFKTVQP
jgi:hypothetical protein